MSIDIPFRLLTSADDADPDARLMVSSLSRRLNGHVVLAHDALVFELDAAAGGVNNREARDFVAALQIRLADTQQHRP